MQNWLWEARGHRPQRLDQPGQKPGDVIMPKMDMEKSQKALEDMMNNPKFKEMMEGQQKK